MRIRSTFFLLFCAFTICFSQHVGIGSDSPIAKLEINHPLADSLFFVEDFEEQNLGNFSTSGEFTWEINNEYVFQGEASAATINPSDDETAFLILNITTPVDRESFISFYLRQDTDTDFFHLWINGTVVFSQDGFQDWTFHKFPIPAGANEIRWAYTKDNTPNFGDDAVWLDSISVSFIESYAFRMTDGNEENGRVLVSDPWGNGSWERLLIREVFDRDGDTGMHVERFDDYDRIEFYNTSNKTLEVVGTPEKTILIPGGDNLVIGDQAGLFLNDNAQKNVLIGNHTGHHSTGIHNSFLGYSAGKDNTTGTENTFLGFNAGFKNTTYSFNTFIGSYAGYTNQGNRNSYFGYQSGFSNVIGEDNVYIGYRSALNSQSGNRNVFIGSSAGENITNGFNSIFIGNQAGQNKTSGSTNIFIGSESGRFSSTGELNVLIGYASGNDLSSGDHNTMLGHYAGWNLQGSSRNTLLGYSVASNLTTGDDNTIIGYEAAKSMTFGDQNVILGNYAATSASTGVENIIIGPYAGNALSASSRNILIGQSAGRNTTADELIFIGYEAGLSNTTGIRNTFLGHAAGRFNTFGNDNTFIGFQAGYTNVNGNENTFIGRNAGNLNNNGGGNTYVGYNAGAVSVSSSENTFIGHQAGQTNSTGNKNTFIGEDAGVFNTTGSRNTFVGENSGYNVTSGYQNVMMGTSSGEATTTGYYNTFIGELAGYFNVTGHNNIAIGRNSMSTTQTANTFCTMVGINTAISGPSNKVNATAIGYNVTTGGSNIARIGNTAMTQIGGYEGWTDLSDGRFKNNIDPNNVPGLDFIKKLRPVTYQIDFNQVSRFIGEDFTIDESGTRVRDYIPMEISQVRNEKSQIFRTGLIAQEVEALVARNHIPFNGVYKPQSSQDTYGLKYSEFVAPLIKAVQELADQVEELKSMNAEQQKTIDLLEKRLNVK